MIKKISQDRQIYQLEKNIDRRQVNGHQKKNEKWALIDRDIC